MGWANIVLKKRKDTPPLYCVPDGFGLTGEQILEMLRKEVKENPSSAEESYGLVILETLEKVFPCTSNRNDR
jgi:ADP-ribose pyrophosphatase YjhB (NUDIX family)